MKVSRKMLAILFVCAFFAVAWGGGLANSLVYDDVTLLAEARFGNYKELFHFFPTMFYNDRPMRAVFLKVLNSLFGLNYQIYHIIFILLHLLNVYLVYKMGVLLFGFGEKKSVVNKEYKALCVAAIFGIYAPTLMAVSWISAIADLLCCFFTVVSLIFYLKARKDINNKYNGYFMVMSILFYYFSLRSKEMSLILPVLLLIFEICCMFWENKSVRIDIYLIIHLLIMLFFTAMLFAGGSSEVLADNPYYQSFSPIILFRNAIRYLFIYFDWGNQGFIFNGYNGMALPGVILFCIICIFALKLAIKEQKYTLLLSIIAVGVSLTTVLPMVNMQHRLYLYIPSIFVGIMFANFVEEVSFLRRYIFSREGTVLFIFCIVLAYYTPGQIGYRQGWLQTCQQDREQFKEVIKLEKSVEGSHIYVKGAEGEYNIYFYGPGNSIKLLFDEPSYDISLVNEFPDNPEIPYVLWEFENGITKEVFRDSTQPQDLVPNILSVYPSEIIKSTENEKIFIGVVPEHIFDELAVLIDGKEYPTTIGEQFISVAISKEDLKDTIKVQLLNKENMTKSKSTTIMVK